MPSVNIIKTIEKHKSFRTDSIIDKYQLKWETSNLNLNVDLSIEDKTWNIGLIVGSSGSGKSTIAKELFPKEYVKNIIYGSKSVIEEMPSNKSIDEITEVFNSVGFGTAWNWLKPYDVLSQGEKMRVDLAKCILEDKELFVFDEFTSVVDRQIGKIASNAISKAIKKTNKKFVAVSCHRDIIEWLEPDWIYDTDKKQFFFAHSSIKGQNCTWKLDQSHQVDGKFIKNFII